MAEKTGREYLDKWPHMKQLMRRFTTRHRIGQIENIETEEDQVRRRRMGGAATGYNAGSMAQRYNAFVDERKERIERYADYEHMMNDPSISSALDIYADEATQKDPITTYAYEVEGDDQETIDEVEKLIHQILRLDVRSWDIIRRTCGMGDNPYEIRFRKDFKGVYDITRISPVQFDRLEEDGKLQGFLLRPVDMNSTAKGSASGSAGGVLGHGFSLSSTPGGRGERELSPFRVVHFMTPSSTDSIYGRSIMEAARRTWRQVRLMEDSVVIYRISRGAERRIFYLNTGHLADDEVEGYIRNTMAKFRKKPFINPQTKDIDDKANPLAWDEDFYIPLQSEKDQSRIEQLPGGQNMGEIEDLRYFKNLIDEELKVPTSYQSRDGSFDSKAGLSQQDIRFSRTIERIQGHHIESVMKICIIHLLMRGFSYRQVTSFTIKMTPPSALAELLRLDALSAKMEAASTAKSLELLPDIYIMTEILGFGEDEANELLQIMAQQRQMAAAAEAGAEGAMGGGGIGGMGGGDLGGMEAGEGGEMEGGEEGAGLGEEGTPEGDLGPEGDLELAHTKPQGKLIAESRRQRPSILLEWVERRKNDKIIKQSKRRRTLSMENMMTKGELGGMKISLASNPLGSTQTITESFKGALSLADRLIAEQETMIQSEVDKLITEEQ